MSHRRAVLALVMSALLVVALSGPAQAGGVARIRGNNRRWHPSSVSVTQGTRVVWRAVDVTHTVTAYGGNWSKDVTLSAGERTSKTFRHAGTFKFRCTIHSTLIGGDCSGMCGRVVVT